MSYIPLTTKYTSQSSLGTVSNTMDDWTGVWRPVSRTGHLTWRGLNQFASRYADGNFRPVDKEGQVCLGRRCMFCSSLDESLTCVCCIDDWPRKLSSETDLNAHHPFCSPEMAQILFLSKWINHQLSSKNAGRWQRRCT